MNSAAARSKRWRSAGGWLRRRNRGEERGRPDAHARDWNRRAAARRAARCCDAGTPSEHVERADPHHRIGIGKALRARAMFDGERCAPSSLSALARAIAGVLRSAATTASKRGRIRLVRPRRMERLGVGLEALAVRPVPAFDRGRRPCRRLVGVTVVAGVGRAELHGQIGTRNAEAVIVPLIDHHVGARRHVARRAGERRAPPSHGGGARPRHICRRRDIAGRRRRRRTKLGAVRLVAVAAGDAGREHLALLERAVVVDLVAASARRHCRARARAARRHACPTAIDPAPNPRKTRRGARDTGRRSRPPCARGAGVTLRRALPVVRIDRPGDIVALVEPNEQTLARVIALAERPPALLRPRPADVPRPLSVTGLAADADLREGGGEAIVRRVVVLAHAGRMALGAHEVPVLVQPGPVQDVVVLDLLVRIEMEPALAALAPSAGCPRRATGPAGGRRETRPDIAAADRRRTCT